MPIPESSVSHRAWWALVAILAVGAVLRLVWLDDIEYKADEEWTWRHVHAAGTTEPLPWVGMPTSAGPENPGMSLWVFLPLRWLGDGPVELARGVALLSIAALVLMVVFACTVVPASERELWLWAAALWAVNPLSVVHHRKIWPPSTFALLATSFLICWWRRERRLSAFCWGILGSILAQINPSAGFFAAGFALLAWLSGRSRVAWWSWFAGSALGSLPLIPWLVHISTASTQPHVTTLKWTRVLEFKFFLRWLTEPFGMGLDHALGDDYVDFLRQPVIGDLPTWLVAFLHAMALAIAVTIGWRLLREWRQTRPNWRDVLIPTDTQTGLICNAAMWGYGILLTLTCLPMHRQYMIIAYSVELLWVAQAALHWARRPEALRTGRRLLAGLVVVQLLLTVSFLQYIHVKQVIYGDYGVAFRAQRSRSLSADLTSRQATGQDSDAAASNSASLR
jgi:hypothetical protein